MSESMQPMGGVGRVAVAVSTEIMVAAVVFLLVVVVFVLFLYVYAKRHLRSSSGLSRSGAHFAFAADPGLLPPRGLDPAVLQALPVTVFQRSDSKEALECAVCLSELSDGEKVRLLPHCNHGFHLECIDMWFHSHHTCPLCRSPVGPEPSGNPVSGAGAVEIPAAGALSGDGHSPESPVFPTNVLFWGTQDHVSGGRVPAAAGSPEGPSSSLGSSSRKVAGGLVIEVPRRVVDGFPSPLSPLPSSRPPTEEMKSPASARLRSLRRLWSRGKRPAGSPRSPHGGDIEQGLVGGVGTSEGVVLPR